MPTAAQTKIVDAALEQVRAEGLDSLSVRNVAARAHYSPAGLYRHFESIDVLRKALDHQVCGDFKAHLWKRLTEEPTASAGIRAAAEWIDANERDSELVLRCTATELMQAGDDRTWFNFIGDEDPGTDSEKIRVASLGWDIMRSLLRLRSIDDFDYAAAFEASTDFLRSARHDKLI